MKKQLISFCILFFALGCVSADLLTRSSVHAQAGANTTTINAGQTPIKAGMCVTFATSGSNQVMPCDNTIYGNFGLNIKPPIGVALNDATLNQPVTVALAGSVVTVPNLANRALQAGEFVGDTNGSGYLQSMGYLIDVDNGPEGYVGISFNSNQSQITILVQPAYVVACNPNTDVDCPGPNGNN